MKLLDSTALAKELGVSRWFPAAAKRASKAWGDTPFRGRYTTMDRFMAWLDRHPDFVPNYWRGDTKNLRRAGSMLSKNSTAA